ncbi:uncharacterized protein ARMOST_14097 [Armillaria ostoyae]|uniref:Uncharacterized protein n=1 Tax=Armillaria ostoyae TaxID=47428 RepID=A0A284RPT6_ARMOS|nr:uncharacterized protein ARMOST_14097 [Armillaria ostoyae]
MWILFLLGLRIDYPTPSYHRTNSNFTSILIKECLYETITHMVVTAFRNRPTHRSTPCAIPAKEGVLKFVLSRRLSPGTFSRPLEPEIASVKKRGMHPLFTVVFHLKESRLCNSTANL